MKVENDKHNFFMSYEEFDKMKEVYGVKKDEELIGKIIEAYYVRGQEADNYNLYELFKGISMPSKEKKTKNEPNIKKKETVLVYICNGCNNRIETDKVMYGTCNLCKSPFKSINEFTK
jgi:hypothetical protein